MNNKKKSINNTKELNNAENIIKEIKILEENNLLNVFKIRHKNFSLKDTFENGQCFRWRPLNEEKTSYLGVFSSDMYILNEIKNDGKNNIEIEVKTTNFDNPKELLINYLDLNKNYLKVYEEYLKLGKEKNIDSIEKAIDYGKSMRILNQDKIETIISFIFSANNNIPRIKASIENLSKNHGEEIIPGVYTFPKLDKLLKVTENDFRNIGAGYRAPNLVKTILKLKEIDFNKLEKLNDKELFDNLQLLNGVGPKVANCIMLFGFHRVDSFPIDTWVKKVMYEEFFDGNEVSVKEIEESVKDFPEKGLLQQLLFYWRRGV